MSTMNEGHWNLNTMHSIQEAPKADKTPELTFRNPPPLSKSRTKVSQSSLGLGSQTTGSDRTAGSIMRKLSAKLRGSRQEPKLDPKYDLMSTLKNFRGSMRDMLSTKKDQAGSSRQHATETKSPRGSQGDWQRPMPRERYRRLSQAERAHPALRGADRRTPEPVYPPQGTRYELPRMVLGPGQELDGEGTRTRNVALRQAQTDAYLFNKQKDRPKQAAALQAIHYIKNQDEWRSFYRERQAQHEQRPVGQIMRTYETIHETGASEQQPPRRWLKRSVASGEYKIET